MAERIRGRRGIIGGLFARRALKRNQQIREQRRILSAAHAARPSAVGALTVVGARGALYHSVLDKIIGAFDRDRPDPQMMMDDLGATAVGAASFYDEEQRADVERVRAVDLFQDVEVEPRQIVPELGPEEDRYDRHLNLIIERVASLESEVSTQNRLIAKLRSGTENLYEQNRRENLEEKRRRSEDDIERGFFRRKADDLKDKVSSTISMAKDGFFTVAKTAAIGGALLAAGAALGRIDEFLDDEERQKRSIELFRDWRADEFDEDAEDASTLEDLSQALATEVVTVSGAAIGSRFGIGTLERFGLVTPEPTPGPPMRPSISPGQTVAYTTAAGVGRQAEFVRMLDTVDSAGRPQVQVRSGGATFAIPETAVTRISPAGAIRPSEVTRNANIFMRSIERFQQAAQAMRSKTNEIITAFRNLSVSATGAMKSFFTAALNYFVKAVVGTYLLFELVRFAKNNIGLYVSGEISLEEYHENNKAQMHRIVGSVGVPFVAGVVGGKTGALLGALFGIKGKVGLGIAGMLGGVLFGIAAEMYYRGSVPAEFLDAMYDSIYVDDDAPLRNLMPRIQSVVDRVMSSVETHREIRERSLMNLIIRPIGGAAIEGIRTRTLSFFGGDEELGSPMESIATSVVARSIAERGGIESLFDDDLTTADVIRVLAESDELSINEDEFRRLDPEGYEEFVRERTELQRKLMQEDIDEESAFELANLQALSMNQQRLRFVSTGQNIAFQQIIEQPALQTVMNRESPMIVPVMMGSQQAPQRTVLGADDSLPTQFVSSSPTYRTVDGFLDTEMMT